LIDWMHFKDGVEAATGLSRDALHVYSGLLVQIVAALAVRRSLAHPVPWLCVLAMALLNEYADVYRDDLVEDWEIKGGQHDLWNTMLAPTVLFLLARFAPRLMTRPAPPPDGTPPS
jgi:hypothetical protein